MIPIVSNVSKMAPIEEPNPTAILESSVHIHVSPSRAVYKYALLVIVLPEPLVHH